jgi:chorismate dehydratase
MARLRIGYLDYINCLPVYHGIEKGHIFIDGELVKGKPAELNRLMAEGNLDLSPISSIEYARHLDHYVLLPDLCLNSKGYVHSVLLVSKYQIHELSGKTIAVSDTSATSSVLLKILLLKRYSVTPDYREMPPDLTKMLRNSSAALLIGDEALSVRTSGDFYEYDIGMLWKEFTGHPIVFVVWAVRNEVLSGFGEEVASIHAALKTSLKYGLANVDEVAKIASERIRVPRIDLKKYYSNLGYGFDALMQKALLFYYDHASSLRLCPPCRELEFVNTKCAATKV